MTEYIVKKSHTFDNDIERIHAYLLRGNYYERTIKEIFETIYGNLNRLRTNPKIGTALSTKTTIPNEYRYLVNNGYLIFYRVFDNEKIVRVYHVYHGRENYLAKLGLN